MSQIRPFQRSSASLVKDPLLRSHINKLSEWASQADQLLNGLVKMQLKGASSGRLTQAAHPNTASYQVTWPPAQGGASAYLGNDGSGGLSWGTPGTLDHQHTATGDGGDTINANNITAKLHLYSGESNVTSGSLRLFDANSSYSNTLGVPGGTGLTADRSVILPDIGGRLLMVGDQSSPAGTGLIASVNELNKNTSLGSFGSPIKLTNGTPAGMYMISTYIECTSAGTANTVVLCQFNYTDGTSAKSFAVSAATDDTTKKGHDTKPIYLNSGNITWFTVRTSGSYSLRIRCSYLG